MQAKAVTQEYRIICPFCDSLTASGKQIPKCYINEDKEVYHCFHCKKSGHLKELGDDLQLETALPVEKKEFNPAIFDELNLQMPASAIEYLDRRFPGFGLGVVLNVGDLRWDNFKEAIALPTRTETGDIVGIKYRMIDESSPFRWISEPGSRSGCYYLSGSSDKILLVEGQFDAIAAKLCGFDGAVIALESLNLSKEVALKLKDYDTRFIMLDGDSRGQSAQEQITHDYQYLNIKPASLAEDCKDFNELLSLKGKEKAEEFIRETFKSDNEKLTITVSDRLQNIFDVLTDDEVREGLSTGYSSIDIMLDGGFRRSDYVIINSYMKSGKTTFVNNLSYNLISSGKKVALASFEMDPDSETFIGAINLAGQTDVIDLPKELVVDHVKKTLMNNGFINNLIVFNKHGKTMWADLKKWLDFVTSKYKIDLIVLDHAGFMVRDMKDATENVNLHASAKQFAVENKIPTVMVTQRPKPARDKQGRVYGNEDLYSSYGGTGAGIACNHYITLGRDEDTNDILKVKLAGTRSRRAAVNETVLLQYDRQTGRLIETYED